jgi:ferrous-iron efflux pump FieF
MTSLAATRAAPEDAARLMRLATWASVAVALTLIGAKLVALWLTGAVSMLSSLVDSMLDAGASIVNLLAVRHALQPADREHRFGHGKAEAIGSLGQAAFIAGSAAFVLFQASDRLLHPRPVGETGAGIAIMVFSIALTGALVLFQRSVMRRTGSLAVTADSLHYISDLFSNLAVIAALLLAGLLGWLWADPAFAGLIALYLLWGAIQVFRAARDQLMDRELPDERRAEIRAIVTRHAEVLAMHDLRTRSSGLSTFIQFHLELAPEMTLRRAHIISDEVEAEVQAAFPGAEIIIHQDPHGVEEARAEFRR